MKRHSVNKGRSSKNFRHHAARTKAINLTGYTRGGRRL